MKKNLLKFYFLLLKKKSQIIYYLVFVRYYIKILNITPKGKNTISKSYLPKIATIFEEEYYNMREFSSEK